MAGLSALPMMLVAGKVFGRLLDPLSGVNGFLVLAVGDIEACLFDGGLLASREAVRQRSA